MFLGARLDMRLLRVDDQRQRRIKRNGKSRPTEEIIRARYVSLAICDAMIEHRSLSIFMIFSQSRRHRPPLGQCSAIDQYFKQGSYLIMAIGHSEHQLRSSREAFCPESISSSRSSITSANFVFKKLV